jgi:molybdenum cofactor cytidylyltransferase
MSVPIAAVILAAGLSSRFGGNKLLAPLAGKPVLRHVAEAAAKSRAHPVIVVTGNDSDNIRMTLSPLPLTYVENHDFSKGLSTSLKCGVSHVPDTCQGALILLGDMPGVSAPLIDRLIESFAPERGRRIIVPARHGRRGNPVLWDRDYFPAIQNLTGDAGARALMDRHPEAVWTVETEDDAPLADIDTQEELASFQARLEIPKNDAGS